MAENVIRQDIIQIGFDANLKVLKEITEQLDDIKKAVNGTGESDGLDKVKKHADKANDAAKKFNTTLSKTASALGNVAKKAAGLTFKATAVGIGACATAIGALAGNAVSAYGEFEQLKGGVETLFGAKGAKSVEEYAKNVGKDVSKVGDEYKKLLEVEQTVIKNANNAYKTAGLSANDYMTTVTSFSASLIQSLNGDTAKAAKLSDKAITDMADNANKMGTDVSMIQNAYQGFAKQNYTMLDNLKLGYGGTKSEMERLLEDAGKLANTKFKITSYADVIEAIHVIQENMGITGTTAKEANFTIQGSISSMKAAWGNLMPALIKGGDDFDQCVNNLIESIVGVKDESGKMVGGVLNNVMPALEKGLEGIGTLIERAAPIIEEQLPVLIDKLLPPLISASVSLFKGLVKALPTIVEVIINELPHIAKQLRDGLIEAFGENSVLSKAFEKVDGIFAWMKENVETIKKVAIGAGAAIGGVFVAFKGFKAIKSVTSLFSSAGDSAKGMEKGEGPLTKLANMKTTTVLKGLANLAIIIGGLALVAAALMFVAPYMAQLSDFRSILKIVGVMGVLGLLGTALALLAGKIGNIPVATVSKGLANMAIVLVGFGALAAVFMWLSPYIAALGDLQSILKVAAIMTVLGTVGTVLSVFAGIVGMIPIPVVLAGLANMALVLAGITGVIVAFGALTKIEGFTEFINTGGEVLVKICDILGEMVGSLLGGAIEGLSNALPALGKNLGQFGKNIKPLFSAMQGVDMAGVGAFFTSLVGLLGIATGNEIVEGIKSFFGGEEESSLSKLGKDLASFAENAKPFFTTVAELPENGFAKATQMFKCLAGISSLPKDGGIVGWFQGEVNYTNISAGLAQLSNENVSGFFAFAAGLNEGGFDKATGLFDCLAGLKSLPKDGGVIGWFAGEVNYANIAAGLGELAGDGVKKFFAMVAGITDKGFTNATKLFECLAGMGDLTSGEGFWDRLKDGLFGDDGESKLSQIAKDLGTFSEKAGPFFKQVNSLNINNLNALWASLENAGKLTSTCITKVLDDSIKSLVDKVKKLPKQMGDGIKSSGSSLSKALVSIWTDAVKAIVSPVNKVISGANWIMGEFGSDKKIAKWQPYARGTSGHKGGNAIVNDGRGAELVQMPNGNTFIPRGRNVLLPNAPKGMKVLDAQRTAKLFGKGAPTFRYAKGTGDIDVWSYLDNSKGLVNAVLNKFVSYDGIGGYALSMGKAMVSTIKGAMPAWVDKVIEETGAKTLADYVASGGVNQWRTTVARALKMEGQYSAANVNRTLYQMQTESGGNPRAINLWDSNAKKGIPSKGLMQVIDPTFKAYARSGFDKNIYDPLSNILASVRYATSRYGSLAKAYQGHGYSSGVGSISIPQYAPSGPITSTSTSATENNTYAPVFNLTISGTQDEKAMAAKVKQWIAESLDECFEGMARRNAHAY